jgi:hypothetical protein
MRQNLLVALAVVGALCSAAIRAEEGGSGANLGDFEGHTAGVGPVVSYARKIGQSDFAAEVKWLPELDVTKRLKGDVIWAKVGVVF